MKQFLTVLQFEYVGYLKTKTFRILTALVVIVVGIILSIPSISNLMSSNEGDASDDGEKKIIIVSDKTGQFTAEAFSELSKLDNMKQYVFEMDNSSNFEDIKNKVLDESAFACIMINSIDQAEYYEKQLGMTSSIASMALSEFFDNARKSIIMAQNGMDSEQISEALKPYNFEVKELGKNFESNYAYAYILIMLLYMTITIYGQLVASSVATEKSSRAMELLITSAKPLNMMFGKVIGSGLAGMTQIFILLACSFGFYKINEASWTDNIFVSSIFGMSREILIYMIIFYILGFFIYAFLFGAIGSLANRLEDINTVSMPVVFLLIGGFLLAIASLFDPSSTLTVVASFIPIFTPMVMFVRVCMTDPPFWQVFISIIVTTITCGLIGWVSAKIYRIGVLMYGKPPKISELFKMLRKQKNY